MAKVLEALVYASERAANVARSCATGLGAAGLLVAEKGEGEANTRFDHDFKTIADVLAQEAARCEVAARCPALADHFQGEECAEIGGVTIALQASAAQTTALLSSLVPPALAASMAAAAHAPIQLRVSLPDDLPHLDPAELGVWIDPIDGTSEFIAGVRGSHGQDWGLPAGSDGGLPASNDGGLPAGSDGGLPPGSDCSERGLPAVTVLVGAYSLRTGEPLVGVINQPFYTQDSGRLVWGACYGHTRRCSLQAAASSGAHRTVLVSAAEGQEVKDKFRAKGWEVKATPGAGRKLLSVVTGSAALYCLCLGSTFQWDTCGPHAVLRALGGDVVQCRSRLSLRYGRHAPRSHSHGFIAYRDPAQLEHATHILG